MRRALRTLWIWLKPVPDLAHPRHWSSLPTAEEIRIAENRARGLPDNGVLIPPPDCPDERPIVINGKV